MRVFFFSSVNSEALKYDVHFVLTWMWIPNMLLRKLLKKVKIYIFLKKKREILLILTTKLKCIIKWIIKLYRTPFKTINSYTYTQGSRILVPWDCQSAWFKENPPSHRNTDELIWNSSQHNKSWDLRSLWSWWIFDNLKVLTL